MSSPTIPLDAIREPAFVYDREGVVTAANALATRLGGASLTGLSVGDLAERVALRLPDGRHRDTFAGSVLQALTGIEPPLLWAEITGADGSSAAVSIVTSPILENGTVSGALSIWHDMTRRDRPHGDLAESEAKYRNLVELAPDAILIHQDGAIVFANPAAADLVGVESAGELVGRPVLEIVRPDMRENVEWNISADLRGEESPLTTVEILRRDGTTLTAQGRGSRVPLGGRPAVQVVLRDVSEQIRTEELLRQSLERLGFAQRAAHSGFWEWIDPPNGLLSWSPELYDLFGLDPSVEPTLEAWLGVIHPDDRKAAMSRVAHSIAERTWLANEYRILLPDGTERWIGAYGDTDYDADGRPLRTAGVCYDITARRRAEAALRESEERMRLAKECARIGILEYHPGASGVTSPDDFLMVDDDRFPDIRELGDWRMTIHPDDLERVEAELEAAIALGEPVEVEFRYDLGGDRTGWLRVLGDGVFDDAGRFRRVLGVQIDITDQKRAEVALQESERRHAFLLELGDRLRELTGVAEITIVATEMLGKHLGVNGVAYCEVDAAGETATVRAAWTDGTVPSASGSYRMDDLGVGERFRRGQVERMDDLPTAGQQTGTRPSLGARAWIGVPICRGDRLAAVLVVHSARPRAWTDAEVELVRHVGDRVWAAIARARAEKALRKRERTLQGIFRAAPVGIGMISGRTITQANDQLCRMTGYPPQELVGRDVRTLYPDDEAYAHVVRQELSQIMADGSGAVETRWVTTDGTIRDILLSYTPLDLSRPSEDIVFNALDITRLRESERALETYMDDLERSNEELQRFAYVASHDLQEPLRSIVSFSQLLERRYKGKLDQDADEYIGFIVEGGQRMQRLILDLLQLSRVETRARPLAPTDAGEVVADALRLMDASIRETGATVRVEPMPTVMADAAQLAQVFVNLVGNALKYRRPGVPPEIRISADRSNGTWRFAVQDNGIGIEAAYFDRIFVIFQRLHTREEYEGTGIGLAVVRKIVERHGGRIGVESTPGQGSTFSFTLPAA